MTAAEDMSVRGTICAGLAAISVLFLGFGSWATLTTITGAVVARGQVDVESSRLPVQHPTGGRIAELRVKEGQVVAAGALLMRLDSSEPSGELTAVESRLAALLAERARLLAEQGSLLALKFPDDLADLARTRPEVPDLTSRQEQLFTDRRAAFQAEVEHLTRRELQIGAEIDGLKGETLAADRQIMLVEDELSTQKELLGKGLAVAPRVGALERETARLQGVKADIAARKAEALIRQTDTQLETLRLRKARQSDATTMLYQFESDITVLSGQRRNLQTKIRALDLVAPVSGVVLGLRVTSVASVLPAAEPALYIVPDRRPLVVEARIAPEDIDEVHTGQPARLRLLSYDSRLTPEIDGTVTSVTPDVLIDQARSQTYYRAEIEIPPAAIAGFRPRRILPGMPVEVFITTGGRTPLSYLTEPLTMFFSRAMRH